VLNDGKVLVTGGFDENYEYINSAELYDPSTGRWSYTGNLTGTRALHTASVLNDGKVLVAGGERLTDGILNSAELYDPSTGK
jgi:N-acetylneuraminic acid mutarotase